MPAPLGNPEFQTGMERMKETILCSGIDRRTLLLALALPLALSAALVRRRVGLDRFERNIALME